MRTMLGRGLATALSLCFAASLSAANPESYSFETCRAQSQCRVLSHAELDRLRGGFSIMGVNGPLEITFGITQMAFVNNQLVAYTQLVLPDVGQAISAVTANAAQLQALNAALQSSVATALSSSATTAASSSAATPASSSAATAASSSAATAASGASGQSASSAATQATGSARPSTPTQAAQTSGQLAQGAPTNTASLAPRAAVPAAGTGPSPTASTGSAVSSTSTNATPVSPGSVVMNMPTAAELGPLIVQNGPGNIAAPSVGDIRVPGIVIQNTVNNTAIRTLTLLNVSTALSQAMSAVAIQDAVRSALAKSRR